MVNSETSCILLGRKEIIAEFKALVSSFPEEMNSMQSQLSNYKATALDIHTVRADFQSLSNIVDRKVGVSFLLLVLYFGLNCNA